MDKRFAIARCLGVVLVLASSTLEVCVEAEGAASSCTIYAITECLEDINSYSAQPSQSCCTEIFALESGGLKAVDCMYTAVTSETAGLYGVNPQHEGPWRLALKRLGSIGFTDYDHNNQAQKGDQV
ncbi:unnamed protein product [Sphagnum troendelagicum]